MAERLGRIEEVRGSTPLDSTILFMKEYRPQEIEAKWQREWETADLHSTPKPAAGKSKLYCLDMFPYPSGAGLHVGHVRIYTASDVLARYFRAKGYSVLHPMGWDAFGLPAENDAIRNKQNPNERVPRNIENFKRQMKMLAFSYDWEREFATCDASYYKWTQWLFLKLYEKGLAYQANVPINWCPSCKTGLADEEAVGGVCDRCGAVVTKKDLKQWLLRITEYADRLLFNLDGEELDWPEGIVKMQKDWIGRSEGITIDYPVVGSDRVISCYSTRPDTNFGATFVVVAPEHSEVLSLVAPENLAAVKGYIESAKRKSELERTQLEKGKTGVFTGNYCLNQLSGKKMPIWVADFVVATAGTGMVVGVPAHDQRDFDFAKNYGLEIIPVVKPKEGGWDYGKSAFVGIDEAVVFNSGFLDGLPTLEAKEKVIDYLVGKGWGKRAVNYHLRDWIFSRQRYWGEPLPLIHCEKCGVVPVPYEDLPVELPYLESYAPTGTGESPLVQAEEWVSVACPKCAGVAKRETDTMPNWAGSCWYFLRFANSGNSELPFSKEAMREWLPVDWYLGGAEHAVLHLLYARFWVKVFYDLGLLGFEEPFLRLRSVGMVLAEDGRKMSKSWRNVINPDDVVEACGADSLRVYEMFMGPWGQALAWSTQGVGGCHRFLRRVWSLVSETSRRRDSETASQPKEESALELRRDLHRLIKKVGGDIEAMKFNTAIAAFMAFVNSWAASQPASQRGEPDSLSAEDVGIFLRLLAPFAPHIAEELWCEVLGNDFSIHQQSWPEYDPGLVEESTVTIVVQVGGKVRGSFESEKGLSEKEAKEIASGLPTVKKHLAGKEVVRVVWVQDRLLSLVTGG